MSMNIPGINKLSESVSPLFSGKSFSFINRIWIPIIHSRDFPLFLQGRMIRIFRIFRINMSRKGPVFGFRFRSPMDFEVILRTGSDSPILTNPVTIRSGFPPCTTLIQCLPTDTGETIFDGELRIDFPLFAVRFFFVSAFDRLLHARLRHQVYREYLSLLSQASKGGPYGVEYRRLSMIGPGIGGFFPRIPGIRRTGWSQKIDRKIHGEGELPFPASARLHKRLILYSFRLNEENFRKILPPPFVTPGSDCEITLLIYCSHSLGETSQTTFDTVTARGSTVIEISAKVGLQTTNDFIEGWLPIVRSASHGTFGSAMISPRVLLEKKTEGFQIGLYSGGGSKHFETILHPLRPYGARDSLPERLNQSINVFIPDNETGLIEIFRKEQIVPVNHLHYMIEASSHDGRDRGPYRFLSTFLDVELEERHHPILLSSLSSKCVSHLQVSPTECMIRLPPAQFKRENNRYTIS